jgi:hypothetical protein
MRLPGKNRINRLTGGPHREGAARMSVDGRWELVISSPIGEQKGTLEIRTADSVLTGVMSSNGESIEIFDGKVNGDKISWSVSITSPMKLTIKSTATVTGDTMKGKAKAGIMPGAPFTGTRVG